MADRTFIGQVLRGLAYFALVGVSASFALYAVHTHGALEEKDQTIVQLQQENSEIQGRYKDLYEQKNTTSNHSLVAATNGVFSGLFDYDTSKDSIKDRRDRAGQFTTENALEDIFPSEANEYNPSVTTVSKLASPPQIFFNPNDSDLQDVLIIIDNDISIAGSDKMSTTFMYKAQFSPQEQKFVSIKNAGTLTGFKGK